MRGSVTADQIRVRVELFADLRQYAPPGIDGGQDLDVPAGTTMHDLIERYGIPADYEVTIGRNGEQAQRTDHAADGDEIVLFSPMEGGAEHRN
jgi:sulfur carrier protein ThiS